MKSSPRIFERQLEKGENAQAALSELDGICMRQPGYVGGKVDHREAAYRVSTHTVDCALVINRITAHCAYTSIVGDVSQAFIDKLEDTYAP